ncbi:hypothetical protein NLI96_g4633 [Meripilus lineatus]|uniref:Uncharacterized protein n=1 Tax=Meripilus lineatus TaxID=2056292 RepID=A0AAD5V9I2_9APHY|nr:hypothetical protein NLI96_g4633 [Physisporinus lineatus]
MLGGFSQRPNSSDNEAVEVNATNGQGYNYPPGTLYPTTTNPPPPPYQSKESYTVRPNGNGSQEDYTAPPPPLDEPPTAHIQDNDRQV